MERKDRLADEDGDESYSHVLKYTGVFGGVQGLSLLVNLVRNKLVAVLLGPGGMGLASLLNTTVSFIYQATNFGLPFSAVKHVSELYDEKDESKTHNFIAVVRVWALLTGMLGMAVCVMLGPVLSSSTFSWGDHTLHFVLLAPAIGLMAITGGETAILKGTRQLRRLATIQIYTVLATLVVSIPIYYIIGEKGIVPVIVLMALVTALLTLRHSYRLYPLRMSSLGGLIGQGRGMIRLGVAFVVAGVMGSGAEMVIRSFLNVNGDLDAVGLYNAGFMLTVTYAGLVFSSMESDYFPRLSGLSGGDIEGRNLVVNRQIEVSLLIVSPMLAALVVVLPVLIPLLFSMEFIPVVGMAQVAVFSMYIKAVSLPVSYLVLARGESLAFMVLEGLYDIVLVALVVLGYHYWGLLGTGVALSLSYVFDVLIVCGYTWFRYRFRLSLQVIHYAAIQLSLGVSVYIVTLIDNPVIYWTLGGLLSIVSLLISLYILHQKTSLWAALIAPLAGPAGRVLERLRKLLRRNG